MGLDMYAYTVKPEMIGDAQVDFRDLWDDDAMYEEAKQSEIAYFRKHANLQGWMTNLYIEKGGEHTQFGQMGWSPLRLTLDDMDRLERDVVLDRLPFTQGFFFGESGPEDKDPTLAFIGRAKVALLEGMVVCYRASW